MKVSELQVDITTYCNSHCGGCVRNIDGGETCVELVHLPLDIFKKINFNDIEVVYFNGAYGDFTMHPDAIDLINIIPRHIMIVLNTNGGARNTTWWKQLAEKLKEFKQSRVTFAIDGVSTNHLYRRGVDIESVLDHAKTFIENGGRARWRYIMFEHNEYEIKHASELAEFLGFEEFKVAESYKDEIYQKKYKNFSQSIAKRIPIDKSYNWRIKKLDWPEEYDDGYRCSWRSRRQAQIDAWGNIWQCCYMPSIATHPHMFKELNLFALENNLNSYEYDEILKSSFFKELFDEPLELCKNCKEWT